MAKNTSYNGTIDLISGVRPKNGGAFPLIDAADVQTREDGTRLDGELERFNESVSQLKDDIAQITDKVEYEGSINLFNKITVTEGKNIASTGLPIDSTDYSISDYISVYENTDYTQMTIVDGIAYPLTQYIGFYTDRNEDSVLGATTSEPWYTAKTPIGCKFVRIAVPTDQLDIAMFVKGKFSPDGTFSSKFDYVEYKAPYYELSVNGNKIDFRGTQVEKNKERIDNLENGTNLPEYWINYLDTKISEINSELVKGFCFPVLFITDTHIEDDTGIEPYIIKYLNSKLHFGAVVHGGDYITSDINRINAFTKIQNSVSSFCNVPVLLTCIGNHDGVNAVSGDVIPKNIADFVVNSHLYNTDIKKPKYNNSTVPQYTDLMANGYYYKDDEQNRIRYIILNSCDAIRVNEVDYGSSFDKLQLKWLAEEALNFTSKQYGWKVSIFSHLFSNQSGIIGSEEEPITYHIDELKEIIEAFIGKTVYTNTSMEISADYSTPNDTKFCGYFCGHYHYDSLTKLGNINVSVTLNASLNQYAPNGYSPTEKIVGTITETAMDVIIFGKDKCILKRIGAGNDREFSY